MNVQKASYLTVEIDFAPLDTPSKERARTNVEDFSRQTQTIRLNKPTDTHTVTDFDLSHRFTLPDKNFKGMQHKIIASWTFTSKPFLGAFYTVLRLQCRKHGL
jgi:hypothetical protein